MNVVDDVDEVLALLVDSGAEMPAFIVALGRDGSMVYLRCGERQHREVLVAHEEEREFVYPIHMMIVDGRGAAYHVVALGDQPANIT